MISPLLSAANRCFCLTAMGRRIISEARQRERFILSFILTGVLCLGLASCGGRENNIVEEAQLRSEFPVPPQVILDGGPRRQQSETRIPPAEKDKTALKSKAPASPITPVQEDTLASIPLKTPEQPTPEAVTEPGLGVLMNLSETQIIDRLGEPSFHRQEGQALHWQYRRDGCILDLFLVAYTRAENAKPDWLVTHIDLRSDRPDAEIESKAIEKCFADMLG